MNVNKPTTEKKLIDLNNDIFIVLSSISVNLSVNIIIPDIIKCIIKTKHNATNQ